MIERIATYSTLALTMSAYILGLILLLHLKDELASEILPILVITCVAGLCFYLAERRGRSGLIGFAAGLMFGPLAIFYYCSYSTHNEVERRP